MAVKSIFFFSESIDFKLAITDNYIDWVLAVANEEEKEIETLNFIFCSDEYLLKVNQEYLNHDYYTDVITFPYTENPITADIFVSIDRVKDNAHSMGLAFHSELQRVLIHGFLHLCGYSDKSEKEVLQMRNKENQYICSEFVEKYKL